VRRFLLPVMVALVAAPIAHSARFAVTVSGFLESSWIQHVHFVKDGCTFTGPDIGGSKAVRFSTARRSVAIVRRNRGGLTYRIAVRGRVRGTTTTSFPTSGSAFSEECHQGINWDGPAPRQTPFEAAAPTLLRPSPRLLGLTSLDVDDGQPWAPQDFGPFGPPQLKGAVGRIAEHRFRDRRVSRIIVSGHSQRTVLVVGDAGGEVTQEVGWTVTFRRLTR
jgi:hypothetical protein